ncbi:MAG: hypothetical protein WA183_02405 [Chthoniobacterales bacterium]
MGTWRTEDDAEVEEMACHRDHTFTSWVDIKNELTTPGCLIAAGEWHLKGRQLVVHFTSHVAVDSWEAEDRQTGLELLRVGADTMVAKEPDGKAIRNFKRISGDTVVASMKRAPLDADFIGTWRIHYHTRDYEMSFGQNHSCGDFAQLDGVRTQFFAGTWRIKDRDLIMNTKSLPAFVGESVTSGHQQWAVIGVEPQRIAIRDGPVQYLLLRLK